VIARLKHDAVRRCNTPLMGFTETIVQRESEKMTARCQPLVTAGETVRWAVPAEKGPGP
jgi:hypothetical protein